MSDQETLAQLRSFSAKYPSIKGRKARDFNKLVRNIKLHFEKEWGTRLDIVLKEKRGELYVSLGFGILPILKYHLFRITQTAIYRGFDGKVDISEPIGVNLKYWVTDKASIKFKEVVYFFILYQQIQKLPLPIYEEIEIIPSFFREDDLKNKFKFEMILKYLVSRSNLTYWFSFTMLYEVILEFSVKIISPTKKLKLFYNFLGTPEQEAFKWNCPDNLEEFEKWMTASLY